MTMVINMNIGERIRQTRQLRGYSQQELASKIGISMNSLYHYEKNRKTPSAEVVAKLAEALGVSADYLLGLTDDPAPKEKLFDISQYLSKDFISTPANLRRIAQELLEMAERMEKEIESNKQQD